MALWNKRRRRVGGKKTRTEKTETRNFFPGCCDSFFPCAWNFRSTMHDFCRCFSLGAAVPVERRDNMALGRNVLTFKASTLNQNKCIYKKKIYISAHSGTMYAFYCGEEGAEL